MMMPSPQTLGYGLSDSPAGLTAWMYDKFAQWIVRFAAAMRPSDLPGAPAAAEVVSDSNIPPRDYSRNSYRIIPP